MRLMYVAVLCLVVISYSSGAVLLGSKRCTWGPSYWCSHLGTMKECRSSSYCVRLWQRSPATANLGASGGLPSVPADCGFCRLLASDLERLARANRTNTESRKLATAACGLVPEQRNRALCLAVVDNYLDEAILLLREGLSADKLCNVLSLCGGGRVDPKLQVAMEMTPRPLVHVPLANTNSPKAAQLRDGVCDLCMVFVSLVKQAADSKAAAAEITQMLKDIVCSRLTDSQNLCNLWMDNFVPQVLQKLASKADPKQICIGAKFCEASSGGRFQLHPVIQLMVLQKSPVKPLRGVECQVCELLVTEARQLLRANKTQAEIIQFIKDRVCSIVPAEKDKCTQAVDEYGPIIFQLLSSELDPVTVCQALGACGNTASAAATAAASSKPRRVRIGPQCLLCEYVMRELDAMLGNNRTVVAIENALLTVCSIMPATVRADCNDWVLHYTPALIELLTSDMSPAVVCTILGLCTGEAQRTMVAAPSTTNCDVCQTVILYVKSLLKDNATEQEVMNVLEKVCNFLPSQDQPACRSFIEQYTPYIIQLLLQDTDPKTICQTIGMCPQASAAVASQLRYRGNVVLRKPEAADDPIV